MNSNEIIEKHIFKGISAIHTPTNVNSRALNIARSVCKNLTPDERNILANEIQN